MGIIGNQAERKIFAGLTDKQRAFVLEYIADLTLARAAREAGYRHANVAGAKLLKSPKVMAAIRALVKSRLDESRLTSENILRQLARYLFSNWNLFLDSDGDLVCSPAELPEEIQTTIERWHVDRDYYDDGSIKREKIRVKLVSKIAAMELALRYVKLLAPEQHGHITFDWDVFYRQAQEPVVDTVDVKYMEFDSQHLRNRFNNTAI